MSEQKTARQIVSELALNRVDHGDVIDLIYSLTSQLTALREERDRLRAALKESVALLRQMSTRESRVKFGDWLVTTRSWLAALEGQQTP